MFLYIIRHGDPDYVTDTLTEKGKFQAELVGKRLADAGIDRVFSSPLGRARETAAPLCRMLGLECTVEDWSREIDVEHMMTTLPDGVPKSISLLQNTEYWADRRDLNYADGFTCRGMSETNMRAMCEEITRSGDEFLARLGYEKEHGVYRIRRPNDERIALFCHGAMGRAWIASLLHVPVHVMWASFSYTHTGVTVIEFKNNKNGLTAPLCRSFCDMSHLYAAGPEHMVYNNRVRI